MRRGQAGSEGAGGRGEGRTGGRWPALVTYFDSVQATVKADTTRRRESKDEGRKGWGEREGRGKGEGKNWAQGPTA